MKKFKHLNIFILTFISTLTLINITKGMDHQSDKNIKNQTTLSEQTDYTHKEKMFQYGRNIFFNYDKGTKEFLMGLRLMIKSGQLIVSITVPQDVVADNVGINYSDCTFYFVGYVRIPNIETWKKLKEFVLKTECNTTNTQSSTSD
jgi:hypothetical protein